MQTMDMPKLREVSNTNNQGRLRSEVVTVTPGMAGEFLTHNTRNRTMSKVMVKRISADIRGGNWHYDDRSISFYEDGVMADGQTRCSAIIETGIPVLSRVTRGLPEGALMVLDRGKVRSGANILEIAGEKNSGLLHAAITVIWKYRHNTLSHQDGAARPSECQVFEVLEINPDVRASVSYCNTRKIKTLSCGGFFAGLHYIVSREHPRKANEFIDGVESGLGLSGQSAVYHLREALLADKSAVKKMTANHRLALVIKAWNKHLHDTPTQRLTKNRTEAFPRISL